MKRYAIQGKVLRVLAGIGLVVSAALATDGGSKDYYTSPQLEKCLNDNEDARAGELDCYDRETKRLNALERQAYVKAYMSYKGAKEAQAILKKSELAWRTYRNNFCGAYEYNTEGNAGAHTAVDCLTEETARHLKEMQTQGKIQ